MKEKKDLGISTLNHLASQRGCSVEELTEIANYLTHDLNMNKAEAYRLLTSGYGVDKSHLSGKYAEGELVNGRGRSGILKKIGAHSKKRR